MAIRQGTDGNDNLLGTDGDDWIYGYGGDDILRVLLETQVGGSA